MAKTCTQILPYQRQFQFVEREHQTPANNEIRNYSNYQGMRSMTDVQLSNNRAMRFHSNEEDLVVVPSVATVRSGRKPGIITKCPHTSLKHFAKGMCNHCYHRYGRKSMVTKCEHKDRRNYAKGKCQNCYINDYNRRKREDLSNKKDKQATSDMDQDEL